MSPNRSSNLDRFVHLAMVGLAASGFFALAGTGRLDGITIGFSSAAFAMRALAAILSQPIRIPSRLISVLAVSSVLFYPVEFVFLGTDFFLATVHSVCFLAAVKTLTAESNRDYFSVGAVAFVELSAGAVLGFQATFFVFLALFALFATAALAGTEIRRESGRPGRTVVPSKAGLGWRLWIATGCGALGVMVLAGGIFLIVPRTARAAARMLPFAGRMTGFSNVVDLGTFGKIARDNSPVMYVQSYSRPLPESLKWRGAALSLFDGRKWSAPAVPFTEVPISNGTAEVAGLPQRSRRDGRRLLYRVDLSTTNAGTLFIAGVPEYINTTAPRLWKSREESFRVPFQAGRELRYEVSALSAPPLPALLPPLERMRTLRLPAVNSKIWDLARDWVDGVPPSPGADAERARRIEAHLRNDFRYSLETAAIPVRDPLTNFLFRTKAGHCEYFASAMAVMLRTVGIPSRVATGYLGGYFNELSGLQVVRASDAHAWVEAWIEGRGWVTFDPTPSGPPQTEAMARVGVYFDALDSWWQRWVMAYDLSSQATLASRIATATRNWKVPAIRTTSREWWAQAKDDAANWALAILTLVSAAMWLPRAWRWLGTRLRLRRAVRTKRPDLAASLLLETALDTLARQGFPKPPALTPMEFGKNLPEPYRSSIAPITELYNQARYTGNWQSTEELARLVAEFPAAIAARWS